MNYKTLHSWDVDAAGAIEIQRRLRDQIIEEKPDGEIRLAAGADISFERFSDIVYAGFVVIDVKTLQVVARSSVKTEAKFPYIPGLLSFREAPPLLEAWQK